MTDQTGPGGRLAPEMARSSRRVPVGIILVVLVVVVAAVAWKIWPRHLPPASDTVAVAKLTTRSDFATLPEAKRREYIRVLRKNSDALANALSSRKLSQAEYDSAASYAWLERQLDHMEQYFELPAGAARAKYVAELAEKSRKSGPSSAPSISNSKTRDKVADLWMADWAGDRKAQWEEFRKASKARK